MAKTTFGPGVIVTSKFLNGAQKIYFDGLDQDWHYDPISISDIQLGGADGLDSRYVTIATDQVYGGTPITGNKSFIGPVAFGAQTLTTNYEAPKSWSTLAKFNQGGSSQPVSTKLAYLAPEDIITKEVLTEQINEFPVIDEGFF